MSNAILSSLPDGAIVIGRKIKRIPVVNSKNKVGRNDLCPCGSGRKYKKCCVDIGWFQRQWRRIWN